MTNALSPDPSVMEIEITVESRLAFAHYGYVYALITIPRPDGSLWLVSGSGDCDVKIWLAHPQGGLQLLQEFTGLHGAVHCFAVRDSLLYAGQQDGEIKVWDLETNACIRSIQAHDADVLTMTVLGEDVYTAAADGQVLRVDERFDCTAAWGAHSGIILSSTIVKAKERDRWELITAGNDSYVKVRLFEVKEERNELMADLDDRPATFRAER
jgi:di- and tripeptidase